MNEAIKIFFIVVGGIWALEILSFLYLHFTGQLDDDDYNLPIGG